MSYSPDTGLVYIPVLDIPATYGGDPGFKYNPGVFNLGTAMGELQPDPKFSTQ